MTHRAQQIVDAVADLLAAAPALNSDVYTHRRYSLSEGEGELPAVIVQYGPDDPMTDLGVTNVAFIDSMLEVSVTALLREDTESEVVSGLLDRRAVIHQTLLGNRSLGLNFVIDTRYGGASAPTVDVSTNKPAGSITSRFLVHYRMNLTDPS